jgi:ERCC4-type nuclease
MLATAYYSYLETIRKTGVDVITTRDLNQSIWWMISLHNYLGKNHYPHHKKYHTMHEIAVGMLTAIPTIGEARANKALKESSIRGMVGMKTVTGLTDKQNEKLQQVLQWREKS